MAYGQGFYVLAYLCCLIVSTLSDKASLQHNEQSEARCDFPVVDGRFLSGDDFYDRFIKDGVPTLITNAMNFSDGSKWPAFDHWRFDNLENYFAGIRFRVGPGPYPTQEMTMKDFIELSRQSHTKSVPNIFQYGQVPTSWSLWGQKRECLPFIGYLHPDSRPIHFNVSFACDKIFNQIEIPHFIVNENKPGEPNDPIPPIMITHSGLLVGPKGSGIDFHKHQDAINLIFHGQKRWFIKIPKRLAAGKSLSSLCEDSSRVEADDIVVQVCRGGKGTVAEVLGSNHVTEEDDEEAIVQTCRQKEGEIIYIPDHYQHAVVNEQPTVAMQMQWYNGDWKNIMIRRYLQQHLLHSLDDSFPNPDSFNSMEDMLRFNNWNV